MNNLTIAPNKASCRKAARRIMKGAESRIVFVGPVGEFQCEDCGCPHWSFEALTLRGDGPKIDEFEADCAHCIAEIRTGLVAALSAVATVYECRDEHDLYLRAYTAWPSDNLRQALVEIEAERWQGAEAGR